jgi:hypothetical protein
VAQAKPFADDFVQRLAAVGTWEAIEADVSAELTPEIRKFQAQIRKDGINHVATQGVLRHDCPPSPAVEAGKDCFVYRLSGSQAVPIGGSQPLKARFRLWVARVDDAWQVINYDYDVLR